MLYEPYGQWGRQEAANAPEGGKTFCDVAAWKGAMETIDSFAAVTTTSIMMMITRFGRNAEMCRICNGSQSDQCLLLMAQRQAGLQDVHSLPQFQVRVVEDTTFWAGG